MNQHVKNLNELFKSCKDFYNEYAIGRSIASASHLKRIIEEDIPSEIQSYLSNDKYKVQGSIGKGRITETLWIAIFNRNITNSATKGVYLVFLFSNDLKHVYFALDQAATEMRSKGGHGKLTKEEQNQLKVEARKKRERLKSIDSSLADQLGTGSELNTAKEEYKNGCIFGEEWNLDSSIDSLETLFNNYLKIYDDYEKLYTAEQKTGMVDDPDLVQTKQQHFTGNMIEEFYKTVTKSGLIYDECLIQRFVTALETKPFVILSGLAGSGKTQLAIAFSKWITKDDSQVCIVPVQSDWTNREPLLGYPDALNKGEYIVSNNVVRTILEANKSSNSNKPYFLILDEMNLSYVERYFADFLSSMESGEPIFLWDKPSNASSDIPNEIKLSRNLFIIGTMNVDETTYMFSPKVLDRANVIEFKADKGSIENFLRKGGTVNMHILVHQGSSFQTNLVEESTKQVAMTSQSDTVINDLIDFFDSLKKVNAEFGFRTAYEINRYINLALKNGMTIDDAVDSAILQKLLPKLHGSRKKLTPVLAALWTICLKKGIDPEENGLEYQETPLDLEKDKSKFKSPLTAEKIIRMYEAAKDNGFTSFAEA